MEKQLQGSKGCRVYLRSREIVPLNSRDPMKKEKRKDPSKPQSRPMEKLIPSKPFRVKFDIAKSTFSDYESFIRSFARNANLQVSAFHENEFSYVFDNQWKAWLNRDSRVELSSPVLNGQGAEEVSRILGILDFMNVRVGENCRAQIKYDRILDSLGVSKFIEKVPTEIWCGFWLVVFLVLKTIEFQTQEFLSLEDSIMLQAVGYFSVALFSVSLYKSVFQRRSLVSRSSPLSRKESNAAPVLQKGEQERMTQEQAAGQPSDKWQDLTAAIKNPLENVMAYARFYQTATESGSQHARDLAELMEQAIRIQGILDRLESTSSDVGAETALSAAADKRDLFRRIPRVLELIPLIVRGRDTLGEEFETPSYTLNTSPRGACLLLPDRVVRPGQCIYLQNHDFSAEAEVRWVVQGKAGSMVFAGVQFGASSSSADSISRSA